MRDWFNHQHVEFLQSGGVISTTRIAKYWAAKEMAATIYHETMLFNVVWANENFPWLIQWLKKEWFR